MTILADFQIRALVLNNNMISPFCDNQKRDGVISYGLSSYGYDARLDKNYKVFHNTNNAIIDPKNFDPNCFIEKVEPEKCIIPPNSFVLASTIELFKIPRNILVICLGKSTYARSGIIVNVTPLEPEWTGHVTLEISNTTPLPAILYTGEGICQFLFFQGIAPMISYADRKGKYQNQPNRPINPTI